MKLYHGSDKIILKPEYNYGNPSNDYGLGFYMSDDKDIARLWASKNPNVGYLMECEVLIDKLNVLYLDDQSEDSILKWITILISHRFSRFEIDKYKTTIDALNKRYSFDITKYDMIVGYRADDSYFQYSRDFVANDLSIEILSKAMKLGKLGKQYVLISENSFKHIALKNYEEVRASDEYDLFRKQTNKQYHLLKKEDDINNTFVRDILRK